MLMERIQKLFGHRQVPPEARDLLKAAKTPREVLRGLDELITRNEIEVSSVNREIEALEGLEANEVARVKNGDLPERSKNNVLRRVQRLRKQMDNLEERQRIYNRNINLQIHLVGRTQALDAMEMRGVDESAIDEILSNYEDELLCYRDTLETEDLMVSELGPALDDSSELASLESEILGDQTAEPSPVEEPTAVLAPAPEPVRSTTPAAGEPSPAKTLLPQEVER